MYKVSGKEGKRTIIHPQRMAELKREDGTYVITCHEDSFSCISHKDGCHRGFFSLFLQALNGIYFAEKLNLPYYVDYGNLIYRYSDERKSDINFWNYYFTQLQSPPDPTHRIINYSTEVYPLRIWASVYIKEIHRVAINKLLWKDDVLLYLKSKTESFKGLNVLGAHIRKTDHFNELTPAPVKAYVQHIDRIIKQYDKLFVATDDEEVLSQFKIKYSDKLIYHNVHRSKGTLAIHSRTDISDRYALGLEALLECYSLSLCKKVILSPSNLSYVACLLNPQLNYTLVESRQAKWKRFKILFLYYLDRWSIRKW
jgi:hypothetical protein